MATPDSEHPSQDEIRRRLARWSHSNDPADLWPAFTESGFRTAQTEIARVTGDVLGSSGAVVRLRLPPHLSVRLLGVAAFASGMGPLLGYWIERGRIEADPESAELLAAHLHHGRRRSARLGTELHRVGTAFRERGIEPVVLKGAHTGVSCFPEPGCRPLSDLDILVSPADWDRAASALADLGYAVSNPGGMPYRTEWMRADTPRLPRSLEVTHCDNPFAIDLHRSLSRAFYARRPAGFGTPGREQTELLTVGGAQIRVLRQPLQLAYLAFHTASHFTTTQLVRLVELLLVIRKDYGTPEAWSTLERFLERAGSGALVYPPLALADKLLPGVIDPGVLMRVRADAPRRMRRTVDRSAPATLQRLNDSSVDVLLMWPMSPRDALAVALDVVWPTGASPLQVVMTHIRRVRRLLRGSLTLQRPR